MVQAAPGAGQAGRRPVVLRGGGFGQGQHLCGIGQTGHDGEFGARGPGVGLEAARRAVGERPGHQPSRVIQLSIVDSEAGLDERGERRAAWGLGEVGDPGELGGPGKPQPGPGLIAAQSAGQCRGRGPRREDLRRRATGARPAVPHRFRVPDRLVELAQQRQRGDQLARRQVRVVAGQVVGPGQFGGRPGGAQIAAVQRVQGGHVEGVDDLRGGGRIVAAQRRQQLDPLTDARATRTAAARRSSATTPRPADTAPGSSTAWATPPPRPSPSRETPSPGPARQPARPPRSAPTAAPRPACTRPPPTA